MKYPVLRTRFLPNLYKHCKKVKVLHVSYEDMGFLQREELRCLWLQETIEKLYEHIESNFTTCQATRVFSMEQETFVVFKDNLTKKLLTEFLENLLAEISHYCEDQVQFSYQLLTAILFQDGCEPRMTMANKLGEDIKDSAEFENAAVYYTAGKPPRGKYFKSWKDYQQHHVVKVKNQPNTTPKKLAEEKKEANKKDEAYMYYI